jgi:hypothetical protein
MHVWNLQGSVPPKMLKTTAIEGGEVRARGILGSSEITATQVRFATLRT